MNTVLPTHEGIRIAADAIRGGEVVAYPTETVYGLAVDPFSEKALARLFDVKCRPADNPVLLLVANEDQLRQVVAEVSEPAAACMQAFWPGPLSLLFPKADRVPALVTAGGNKVCVRVTSCAVARDLCLALGAALTSSSANRAGHPPARCLAEIELSGVTVGIDGGPLEPSPPSTVFDPDSCEVVRAGAVSEAALLALLGRSASQNLCRLTPGSTMSLHHSEKHLGIGR